MPHIAFDLKIQVNFQQPQLLLQSFWQPQLQPQPQPLLPPKTLPPFPQQEIKRMRIIIHEQLLLQNILLTPFHHHYTEKSVLCYCISEKTIEQNIKGDRMNNETPHITIGQIEPDPFISGQRSKTMEHTDRLRSDFSKINSFKNSQKTMKIEENTT